LPAFAFPGAGAVGRVRRISEELAVSPAEEHDGDGDDDDQDDDQQGGKGGIVMRPMKSEHCGNSPPI
jgi:hypothetical protein